jgi:hypothetical protein
MSNTENSAEAKPAYHKRKLRNYLLDVGLQLRYTLFIIIVAVLLTAVLGFKIYEATQESSRIVTMTGLVDPSSAQELQEQFRSNDRVVLYGIIGFGVLLVLSVTGAGIWMTHKVAGPLYKIGVTCSRIRDNKLPASLRNLRRGDELQGFYATFGEMCTELYARTQMDVATIQKAIEAIEACDARSPALDRALSDLRETYRRKQDSLESPS